MAEVWLCAEWGGRQLCGFIKTLYCQSIPWAWISFDKAQLFAVTLLVLSDNEDVFTSRQRNRLREPPHKTVSLWASVWVSVVGGQNEWICLNILCGDAVFLCFCLCQCWQAQFHSRPWLVVLPRFLLESIKVWLCWTHCSGPSAASIQTVLDLMGCWNPSRIFEESESFNLHRKNSWKQSENILDFFSFFLFKEFFFRNAGQLGISAATSGKKKVSLFCASLIHWWKTEGKKRSN